MNNTNKKKRLIQRKWYYEIFCVLFILAIFSSFASARLISEEEVSSSLVRKEYNDVTRTVTINNSLFSKEIQVRGITPQVYSVFDKGPGIKQLIAEMQLTDIPREESLDLSQLELVDLRSNIAINRDVEFKYKNITGNVIVNDFATVCNSYDYVAENTSSVYVENCSRFVVGSHSEKTFEWVTFNSLDELPNKRNINVGLFTDVKPGDHVEWIPTWFGARMPEFAEFTDALRVGIVSFYKLNQTTGNVIDSVGNYNGTITAGVTRGSPGIINNSFLFNGTFSNRWEVTDPDKWVEGGDQMTISAWVNYTASHTGVIARYATPVTNPSFHLVTVNDAGQERVRCRVDNSAGGVTVNTPDGINDGTWHNVVCVVNSTHVTIYDNAVFSESSALGGTFAIDNEGATFGEDLSGTEDLNANVDEIGIWNVSLALNQILDLFNNGTGITFVSFTPSPPEFVVIPANASIVEGDSISVDFVGNDTDGDFDSFSINDTANFAINQSGRLTSAVLLSVGTFLVNVTINDTTGLQDSVIWQVIVSVVPPPAGVTAACEDSDVAWTDAAALTGIIFTILLVGLVLSILVLSMLGVASIGQITSSITLENMPAAITMIGLTFLVIATMSFLIVSNVCVAFGA